MKCPGTGSRPRATRHQSVARNLLAPPSRRDQRVRRRPCDRRARRSRRDRSAHGGRSDVHAGIVAGQPEGIPFGGYARLVGAPHYAPSLRSVAGLLLALALESRLREPPPPSFLAHRWARDRCRAFGRGLQGRSTLRNARAAHALRPPPAPTSCAKLRAPTLRESAPSEARRARAQGTNAYPARHGAHSWRTLAALRAAAVTDLCREVRVSSEALSKASARRRPATERSEGA